MRAWTRAVVSMKCGSCGDLVRPGDPFQAITLDGLKRTKVRCQTCGDGPVPPELPAVIKTREPLDLTPLKRLAAALPFEPDSQRRERFPVTTRAERLPPVMADWKSRGAGEREPGQEG